MTREEFQKIAADTVVKSCCTAVPTDRAAVFWPAQAERSITDALIYAYNVALDELHGFCLVYAERGRGPLATQLRQICTMQCETIMEEIVRLQRQLSTQQRVEK